jgi:Tfp pilus assembly protein PilX
MCCSRTIRSPARERGFVLATTLLVTTLLTVMLAASFLLVSAEQRTTDNSFGTVHARALAQAGLQNYFVQSRGIDTSQTYDSTRIALSGGYADVVARRLRPTGTITGSILALWLVRSTGVATDPVMAGQVQGTHTIAQFARYYPANLPARAPMVALNGVSVTAGGADNPLNGHDLGSIGSCTSPGGGLADTVAVAVPAGGYYEDAGPDPSGRIETFPSWSALYDSTHIDWASLVAGNFRPDFTIPPASYPGFSNSYLVYFVQGNAVVPANQRRGMLVVTGNVSMSDGAHWDGIILAGGSISGTSGAADWILHGMAVTGLNMTLGMAVSPNSLKRRNADVQWSWCYTQSSINSFSSLVPVKNGWVDTWSTY